MINHHLEEPLKGICRRKDGTKEKVFDAAVSSSGWAAILKHLSCGLPTQILSRPTLS